MSEKYKISIQSHESLCTATYGKLAFFMVVKGMFWSKLKHPKISRQKKIKLEKNTITIICLKTKIKAPIIKHKFTFFQAPFGHNIHDGMHNHILG